MSIAYTFDGAFIREDYVDGLPSEPIDDEIEIADGWGFWSFPVTCGGLSSFLLDLKDPGPMFFTSYAIYMKTSFGQPTIGSPFKWSTLDWLGSVEKVRQLSEKRNATLMFGHDKELIDHGLRHSPSFYTSSAAMSPAAETDGGDGG